MGVNDLFCEYQMANVLDEKTGRKFTACCAHLAEGHVFECHYSKGDVIYDSREKFRGGLRIPGDEDFDPLPEMVEIIKSFAQKRFG
jgi:hypothetical protein